MSFEINITQPRKGFTLDVQLQTGAGVTVLFGPSGAGKTSVVQAVAGLETPAEGRIQVAGKVVFDRAHGVNLPPKARRIGYVFQDGRLFPHLTVAQNLDFAARFGARPFGGDPDGRAQLITLLGLEQMLARFPTDLSGGEKQRVAIGRALMADPMALCLDEPLAALDGARKLQILPYLERLRDHYSLPMLYVSHDISEVARMATTLAVMRDGRVVRSGGLAQVLGDPAAAQDLGPRAAGAVLTARVGATEAGGVTPLTLQNAVLRVPAVRAVQGALIRLRIAAHDVILATEKPEGLSAMNVLPVVVTGLHKGPGSGVMVQLDLGGDPLLARITQASLAQMQLQVGMTCFAIIKATAFDPAAVGT